MGAEEFAEVGILLADQMCEYGDHRGECGPSARAPRASTLSGLRHAANQQPYSRRHEWARGRAEKGKQGTFAVFELRPR